MGATPPWKVYRANGDYLAATISPEYAAMLLSALGDDGATIRHGHTRKDIAWTEGEDGYAANSYDRVD